MQGHVRQRKSKKWSFIFELGYIDGKRKQKEVGGFDTKKEAQKALRKALTESDNGSYIIDKNITLSGFLDYWIANYVDVSLRYSTKIRYSELIKLHIKPELGNYKLSKLNHLILQRFITDKHNEGYAFGTISILSAILSGCFKHSIAWGFLNHNPMDTVSMPKKNTKKKINTLSENDIKLIYNKYQNTKYILPFLIALYTGMRVSEILGLVWENVDFENNLIYITHTLQKQNKKWILVDTKTTSSVRSIMMSESLIKTLKQHKQKQLDNKHQYGTYYINSDYVCVEDNGKVFTSQQLSYFIIKLNRETGIKIRFHDIRHTFASNMLKLGIHPKIVQEMLGHSSIATTLDTYSHLTPNLHTDAIKQLTAFMDNIMPTE